jgi:hypothetical protein
MGTSQVFAGPGSGPVEDAEAPVPPAAVPAKRVMDEILKGLESAGSEVHRAKNATITVKSEGSPAAPKRQTRAEIAVKVKGEG